MTSRHTGAQPQAQRPLPRRSRSRRDCGAVMVQTVMILPFVMVVLVLLVYLGWNVRRLQKVTNMDRYVAWNESFPGAPGPSRNRENDHAVLNQAFFTLDTGDTAERLEDAGSASGRSRVYDAYELLLSQLADEDFAYFQNFLEDNPSTNYQRFEAEHADINEALDQMGMSNLTRNATGHVVRNGDWRYADGVRENSDGEWQPGARRITPSPSLSEVFFVQFDEELMPLVNNNNPLARATHDFYRAYPGYRGPDME